MTIPNTRSLDPGSYHYHHDQPLLSVDVYSLEVQRPLEKKHCFHQRLFSEVGNFNHSNLGTIILNSVRLPGHCFWEI